MGSDLNLSNDAALNFHNRFMLLWPWNVKVTKQYERRELNRSDTDYFNGVQEYRNFQISAMAGRHDGILGMIGAIDTRDGTGPALLGWAQTWRGLVHLRLRSEPDLSPGFTSSSLPKRRLSAVRPGHTPVFWTDDDVQWNASRVQPYFRAEPSAARFRRGTAKCKRTIPRLARKFLLV